MAGYAASADHCYPGLGETPCFPYHYRLFMTQGSRGIAATPYDLLARWSAHPQNQAKTWTGVWVKLCGPDPALLSDVIA